MWSLNSEHASNIADSDNQFATEKQLIHDSIVISHMARFSPFHVVAIKIRFTYAVEWTPLPAVDKRDAWSVVHGSVDISDMQFNLDPTHAPVAYESSLLVTVSMFITNNSN